MKNIIYLTTLILFTTTIAFSQIEKVDTLINVDLNINTSDILIDLDKDGTYDLLFQNLNNTTLVKNQNGAIEMVLANSSLSYNQTHIGECTNNNTYSYYYYTYLIHTSIPSLNIPTGNNVIPFKLWVYNAPTSTFEAKYALLKVFRNFSASKYTITGWYINHTVNTPLSCDLIYNDSIISSYNNNSNVTDTTTKLPVELIDFSVQGNENNVELHWQTATEENNYGFEVERSIDGINFEVIGFINGNSTTYEYSNYSFLDENPINGINYYRLKQIDFDGNFEYSQIESVNFNHNPFDYLIGSNISPNPAMDYVLLNLAFEKSVDLTVRISNVTGHVLETRNAINTTAEEMIFDLNRYSTGLYFIQIISDNYSIAKKFVVIK